MKYMSFTTIYDIGGGIGKDSVNSFEFTQNLKQSQICADLAFRMLLAKAGIAESAHLLLLNTFSSDHPR